MNNATSIELPRLTSHPLFQELPIRHIFYSNSLGCWIVVYRARA